MVQFRYWYINYNLMIASDFADTYNSVMPSDLQITYDEASKIISWIYTSLHKLHYLNILDDNGNPYTEEQFNADLFIQDQLNFVFKHNMAAIVNNYKQMLIYSNIEDGKNIMETKFNPIDNTEDILKNSSNSGTVQTNKHDIAFKQNMYIKDAHELIAKIKSEFEQFLEVYA